MEVSGIGNSGRIYAAVNHFVVRSGGLEVRLAAGGVESIGWHGHIQVLDQMASEPSNVRCRDSEIVWKLMLQGKVEGFRIGGLLLVVDAVVKGERAFRRGG